MKTNFDKEKPITWEDIKNQVKVLEKKKLENGGLNDEENTSQEFKNLKAKILGHLDNLQEEQDKKIIQFSKKKKENKNGN